MKGIQAVREAAFARLQALDQAGRLTPKQVVKEARNEKSPLHFAFPWTWDTTKASQKWLEHQARKLIESYYVTVSVETVPVENRGQVVAFVRDPEADPDQQQYVAAARLEGEAAERLLAQELARIAGYIERGWGIAQQVQLEEQYVERLTALVNALTVPA